MSRSDLSNDLIHWTKGDTYDDAYQMLTQIVLCGELFGGTGMIKGNYRCVCFTETPQDVFHRIEGKYKPFGLVFSKSFIYSLGGRPVIYQGETEFEQLPEASRWRHVRYDPISKPPIDFTWEREWRLHRDSINLNPDSVKLILPDEKWIKRLLQEYEENEIQWSNYVNAMLDGHFSSPDSFPFKWEIVPYR